MKKLITFDIRLYLLILLYMRYFLQILKNSWRIISQDKKSFGILAASISAAILLLILLANTNWIIFSIFFIFIIVGGSYYFQKFIFYVFQHRELKSGYLKNNVLWFWWWLYTLIAIFINLLPSFILSFFWAYYLVLPFIWNSVDPNIIGFYLPLFAGIFAIITWLIAMVFVLPIIVALSLSLPIYFSEGLKGFWATRKSWSLVKWRYWRTFWILVTLGIISVVLFGVVEYATSYILFFNIYILNIIGSIFSAVLNAFISYFVFVFLFTLYEDYKKHPMELKRKKTK